MMILEVAPLQIKSGQTAAFEVAFKQAQDIIVAMDGYVSHELQRCIENKHRYILLVYWHDLQSHTEGFRHSAEYQQWKALLHHFYEPFPEVLHYEKVFL